MQGPWSDGVPTGWQLRPLWSEFRRGKTLGDGSEELLSVYRDYGVIPKSSREDNFNKPSEDLSKYQRVSVGDLVVNKMKAWQGSLGISNHDGIVSPAYFVYKATGTFEPRFAHYLLRSKEYADHMAAISSGIRPNQWDLDPAQFAVTPLLVPPPAEQRAIADYLDRETTQIDAFIAKNEELITLLTERRAAVITRSVSRGVRDGVALRPSGAEWATDVPSHWRVGNIRRFASMKTGHTPSRQHPEYWVDCDIPWFTLADVWQLRQGRRDMDETSEKISSLGLANSAAELLPAGTVALSRTASVGFAGIMPVAMATSQDFWNWIPNGELLSEYLWFQFQAMKPEFERLMTGSTHRTIYQTDAASFTILVPPLSEQHEIVERLSSVTRRIDDAIATAHRGVALARERRAAVISAAVTGKIDVGVAV